MVMKRKTISKLASVPKFTKAAPQDEVEEEPEAEMQIVAVEQEEKELSEQELVAVRTKELKSFGAADLKELLTSNGLETGKKEDMIKTMLKFEAKMRSGARDQKSKIRAVVVKKKQELDGQSLAELGKLCESIGLKGLKSKEERVQRLLVNWQEQDGVDKALAQIAQEERQHTLIALDNTKLQKICTKIGVDPFVKEIMVERISKRENETGCYSRPAVVQEAEASKEAKTIDMVDALLANEAQRKKEQELKSQKDEAALKRRKELKGLSLDDLKKRLTKKGLEASGKKDEMVETLFIVLMQEDIAAERKSELLSKSQQELKEVLSRNGLEVGTKENMVKTLLVHEAKCRKDMQAFDVKVGEVAEQQKVEFEKKNNAALKEMCAAKGLPVGGDKEERIERIVEEAQKEGNLDKIVSSNLRNKRKEELMCMDKPAVAKLCEQNSVDPFVKDIMIERIIAHETEGGEAIAMADAEPAAKKARVSKK